MLYKVYKLLFPYNEVYIGKTDRELELRWVHGLGYKLSSEVRQAIEKYGWENVQTFILHENLTYEEACRLEVEEIKNHGGVNHPLVLNEQSGGDKGFYLSENGRKKVSEGRKKYFDENPDAKEKLSKSLKKVFSEHPEIHDIHRTAVDQYSYDGILFIASYNSVSEAERVTGICYQHIASCLTGARIAAGRYRWVQHGKRLGVIQYKRSNPSNKVQVDQIDKDTNTVVATFDSIAQASSATNTCSSSILKCVNGERQIAGGYKWRKTNVV